MRLVSALRKQVLPPQVRGRTWRALALTMVAIAVIPSALYAHVMAQQGSSKLDITRAILARAEHGARDAWGSEIRVERHVAYVVAASAGEDAQFETADDLVVVARPR